MTIFEQIIARDIPAEIIHEDDQSIAIMDIHPVNPGHILVIPKQPIANWYQLSDDLAAHLFAVAHKLGKKIQLAYNADKVALVIAGFDVEHTHLNAFPAKRDDINLNQDMTANPDFAQLALEANKIRS